MVGKVGENYFKFEGLHENYKPIFGLIKSIFDCIDHKRLIDKMNRIGVRGFSLNWIQSYFKNQKNRLK